MAKECILVLHGYSMIQSSLVNQFLHDCGLCGHLCVVVAEIPTVGEFSRTMRPVLGIEALTKEAEFYWNLKGSKTLLKALEEYARSGKTYDFQKTKSKNYELGKHYCRSCRANGLGEIQERT